MEKWRDISEFEGHYQVSNYGNVRSIKFNRTLILKPSLDRGGYLKVVLIKNNIRKYCLIHRLVAQAFIPNPNNLPEVNHKDEDKTNNFRYNLEWCTSAYNTEYSQGIAILQLNLKGELVKEYKSSREAGRNGFHQGAIIQVCKGKYKQHRGFKWCYKDKQL